MKIYNKIRALLNGKRKYVAIRHSKIHIFYSPSIEHANSRFKKGKEGEWSVFLLRDLKKQLK